MCRRAAGGATREGSAERRACPTLALSSTVPRRIEFILGSVEIVPSVIWREPLITRSLLAHREAGLERYSRRPDSLAIIRAFHVLDMMLKVNVWFNYVASKANIADLPSRDAIEEMAEAIRSVQEDFSVGDSEVAFAIPPILVPDDPASLAELWDAVATAVGSAPPAAGTPAVSPAARPARHARAGKRCHG